MEIITMFVDNGDVVAIIVAAVLFFERVGKLIPDDAAGILGLLRKLSKLGGMYVRNRKNAQDDM